MPKILSVYLVRHGESEANLDKSVNAAKADHAIELSPNGADQAVEAGIKLATFLKAAANAGELIGTYVSPYTRTRQTWQHMKTGIISAIGHLPAMRQSLFIMFLAWGEYLRFPKMQKTWSASGSATMQSLKNGFYWERRCRRSL
jgi:broad specificity phosphatase PhoE